jgi:RNA polymerase sigma factor (sigma-70 family)
MTPSGRNNNASHREFERLLGPHLPGLYRTAVRFTGHREDAEDLVQRVLLKLYPQMDRLRKVEQLRPWLTRVLYREFIDAARARNRLMRWLMPASEMGNEAADHSVSDQSGPEDEALRDQEMRRLRQALHVLNSDQRALIALHDMEGYTLDEISTVLEIKRGTVKSRLRRARARLRLCMSREPFSDAERVYRQRGGK